MKKASTLLATLATMAGCGACLPALAAGEAGDAGEMSELLAVMSEETDIATRTKQGFSAPDASWFRGESIEYVNRLLRARSARMYEFFNPAYVERVLEQHTGGKVNHRLLIWSLLSFEWWLRTFC